MSPQDGSSRWALSPLDFRAHAVAEFDNHPIGVLIARCGHRLPMVVELEPEPPAAPCQACAMAVAPQLPDSANPPIT